MSEFILNTTINMSAFTWVLGVEVGSRSSDRQSNASLRYPRLAADEEAAALLSWCDAVIVEMCTRCAHLMGVAVDLEKRCWAGMGK